MPRRNAHLAPLVVAVSLVASVAHAGDDAAAQALFDDARNLVEEGRYAEACPKLEESERLDPAMGTEYNLASCYQHVGKVASAWALFLAVAAEAKTAGQRDREKAARDRAAALEGTLPRLRVIVYGTDVAGLEVKRDGTVVGPAQWRTPVPIDPGTHTVSAQAPGHRAWRTAFDVPATPDVVDVEVRALEPDPVPYAATAVPPPASPPVPGATNAMPRETPEAPVQRHAGRAQRVAGGVIGFIGLGAVATGIVMGLESQARHDQASAHCEANLCDPAGVALRHDAVVDGDVATLAFGVGGAALIGAILLFATAPTAAPREASIHAAPIVGRDTSGVAVVGAF